MGRKLCAVLLLCVLALIAAAGLAHAAGSVDFFTDTIAESNGMYKYVYVGGTTLDVESSGGHEGEGCLKAVFDCGPWSGAAVGHYPLTDLSNFNKPGVEFWVKGAAGGEKFEVILIDADDSDGNKTEIGAMASPNYARVTTDWQKVVIPFNAYPKKGQYWDNNANKMVTGVDFNPSELKEIKFAVGPAYNPGKKTVTIYVDGLKIVDMQ